MSTYMRVQDIPDMAHRLPAGSYPFEHFRGETFVLGRCNNPELLRYLCGGVDDQVRELESHRLMIAGHHLLIDLTVWSPRLRFFYPPDVQALAQRHGERTERAIVRALTAPGEW